MQGESTCNWLSKTRVAAVWSHDSSTRMGGDKNPGFVPWSPCGTVLIFSGAILDEVSKFLTGGPHQQPYGCLDNNVRLWYNFRDRDRIKKIINKHYSWKVPWVLLDPIWLRVKVDHTCIHIGTPCCTYRVPITESRRIGMREAKRQGVTFCHCRLLHI